MIELFIADDNVTSGTIAISWCVSHETLDFLANEKVANPQLVICVSPEGEEYSPEKEYRKVVPLKDMMTYIEFHVPGKNKISAFLSHKNHKEAKDKYLSKNNGSYDSDILNSNGSDYSIWLRRYCVENESQYMLAAPIIVNVPLECFAPEPPKWEKLWVNYFFRDKPIDQCHYRKRRLFAYLIQPFIFVAFSLIKLLPLLVATLVGSRNWSLKYLLHPLTYDVESSTEVVFGGSIFIRKLPEDDLPLHEQGNYVWYLCKKLCLLPLMPMIFIPLALLIYFHIFGLFVLAVCMISTVMLCVVIISNGMAKNVISWCYD